MKVFVLHGMYADFDYPQDSTMWAETYILKETAKYALKEMVMERIKEYLNYDTDEERDGVLRSYMNEEETMWEYESDMNNYLYRVQIEECEL